MIARLSARHAFLGFALTFLSLAALSLAFAWTPLVAGQAAALPWLRLVGGLVVAGWGFVGPRRMGWSDKRFPDEVRAMLQSLAIGLMSAGGALCLSLVPVPLLSGLALLGAAGGFGYVAFGSLLRLRRSLPAALTLGEIYANAKSAGVFGGATADNSTKAFSRWAPTGSAGVPVGAAAPDGRFEQLDGTPGSLAAWLAEDPETPVVLNLGSYTCPHHRKRIGQLHELYDAWAPRGVRFLTVYTAEAHPEDGWSLGNQWEEDAEYDGNPDNFCFLYAKTTADRREMARWLIEKKDFRIPVVLDSMEDTLLFAYNSWPIRLYVIHRGRIVYSGAQGPFGYEPPEVGAALERLIGRTGRARGTAEIGRV